MWGTFPEGDYGGYDSPIDRHPDRMDNTRQEITRERSVFPVWYFCVFLVVFRQYPVFVVKQPSYSFIKKFERNIHKRT